MKRKRIGAVAALVLPALATGLACAQPPTTPSASATPHVDPEKIRAQGSAEITRDIAARIADLLLATASPQANGVTRDVHVGAPVPGDVDLMPLPTTIADLIPEYRDYEYVVVNNRIVFVKPSTRQVVEVIDAGGG